MNMNYVKKHFKSIYKCLILIGFICLCVCSSRITNAYSETGHEDFKKITLFSEAKLLKEIWNKDIDKKLDEIPWMFFGWGTKYFCLNEKIEFEGDIIFSRSNKTDQVVTIDYYIQEAETTETSVAVKGTVSTKITGKIKKINMDISGSGDLTISKTNTNSYESSTKTSFKIVMKPYTKVTLQIKGTGRLTNGVSKYRFLGIVFNKGAWERIDVETMYYELKEEVIE